jgi:hypothetical protein
MEGDTRTTLVKRNTQSVKENSLLNGFLDDGVFDELSENEEEEDDENPSG